jgi:hypothetical protein
MLASDQLAETFGHGQVVPREPVCQALAGFS